MHLIDNHGEMTGNDPFSQEFNKRVREYRQKEKLVLNFTDAVIEILIDDYNKRHENTRS